MHDLFDQLSYPDAPGYQKNSETSREAARCAQFKMRDIHQRILDVMADKRIPMHFYQIADLIGEDSRNVQPRTRELELAGKIRKGPRIKKSPDSHLTLTGWILA